MKTNNYLPKFINEFKDFRLGGKFKWTDKMLNPKSTNLDPYLGWSDYVSGVLGRSLYIFLQRNGNIIINYSYKNFKVYCKEFSPKYYKFAKVFINMFIFRCKIFQRKKELLYDSN